jgi:hypothetical protein
MFLHDLMHYADLASSDREIGVVVRHIFTDAEVTVSYDVIADISVYGELLLCISIEPFE